MSRTIPEVLNDIPDHMLRQLLFWLFIRYKFDVADVTEWLHDISHT